MLENNNNPLNVPLWTKQFLLITIINLFLYFSFQLVTPTISIYLKELGASAHVIGWLNGVFTLATLLIRPVAGETVDRLGRKGVFQVGIWIFILGTASYAWVRVIGFIFLFRFIHGIGWGTSSTALYTIASDNIPGVRFGEGMGYFTLASNLAMAFAPALGMLIIASFGYQKVSILSAILAMITWLLSFGIRQRIVPSGPKKPKRTLFEKTSIRPAVVMFFITMSYGALNSFLALHAMERGVERFGIFFTVMALTMFATRPLFGRVVDRHGVNPVVYSGMSLIIVAIFLLAEARSLSMFLLTALCYGTGFSAVHSSLQTLAVIYAPRDRLGIANSTFFVGFDGGIGAGSVLLGIVASRIGYAKMFRWSIVSVLLALLLYLFTCGRTERGLNGYESPREKERDEI